MVKYLCDRGNEFAPLCDFSIGFWHYSDSGILFILSVNLSKTRFYVDKISYKHNSHLRKIDLVIFVTTI